MDELATLKINDDDDELLVRASAVLKSQGPENWSRGPWETRSPLGAYKLALCPGRIVRENPGGKTRWWGDAM